jgi:putative ABC transport system substrate-binding protein
MVHGGIMGHVHRRRFMTTIGALLAGPLSRAQQAGRTYRVAIVHTTTRLGALAGPNPEHTLTRLILHELRDLGYVEGRNLIFDRRSAEGDPGRYPQILGEVIRPNTDAIILPANKALIEATRAATRTIPIVLMGYPWPVEDGFAASLARPGGNITGLAWASSSQLGPKLLQMFKQAVPSLKRVALLGPPFNHEIAGYMAETAATLGFELQPVVAHPSDPEVSFARIMQLRVDGMLVEATSTNYGHRKQLGRLAYEARLPSIDTTADAVEAGGLMSYGPSADHIRRVAHYIDKIFKGAQPGDLPMEMATKRELVINLKTAKAIGITIPQSVLLQAARLIE